MTAPSIVSAARVPGTGAPVVRLAGELDLYTVTRIEPVLASLVLRGEEDVALDLSCVPFCDSSGVALFARLHRRCEAVGTRLRLRAVPPGPARVFRALGLDRVVTCHFQ
ncbi:STAS domain-containing protein [Streptomyces buecherae]|uniref:Anti-sigma factor antagonist n=1 Tax=Streptomyces buecherae TaxID=2763006 RepID=A0A7H8N2B9_9ACTN|nr:STAS domain-containing protein [Streptomyces buecherae]QKW48644.1 STAS domain-containing protein [Streptomyces buecherae]